MAIRESGDDQTATGPETPNVSQEAPGTQPKQDIGNQSSGGPQPYASAPGVGSRQQRSMTGITDKINRSMKRSQLSESVNDFKRAAEAAMEHVDVNNAAKLDVLALDAASYGLHYSAAVLTGTMTLAGREVVAAYTMILESSASKPRPFPVNAYGRQVEIVLTAMNAWDAETYAKVEAMVATKHPQAEILNAGSVVVPKEADLKDSQRTWEILWNGSEAVNSTIESKHPEFFEHVSIGQDFNRQTDRIGANFIYNAEEPQSVVGLPIRSDITIDITASQRDQNSRQSISSFQHQTGKDLLQSYSYVDLVYAPGQQQQMASPMGYQQPTQLFLPRVVITGIQGMEMMSPELFFMGLGITYLLKENYNWAYQFANYAEEELHDIGAVGYRMRNPNDPNAAPARIDTKTNSFTQESFYELIQTVCQKDPVFTIDCEDAGPQSWLTGAFVEAANGNTDAHQFLLTALNTLTDGNFSRHYPGGPLVIPENNKVHLGTYVDNAGITRDIREIDNLAVLNLQGHNDLNAVATWEQTFNDTNTPIEMRLETRLQMLRNLTDSALTVRGLAERLIFNPDMMGALVQGMIDSGIMVDQEGLTSLMGSNNMAGNTFLSQYAAHGSTAGMVNTGSPMQSIMGGGVRRW